MNRLNTLKKTFFATLCMALFSGSVIPPALATSQAPTTAPRVGVTYDRALITKTASTNSDVGIAFFKTAGIMPDFQKLIEASDEYKAADPLQQNAYLTAEQAKLNAAYLAYSPGRSDLIVRMKVTANFKRLENGGAEMTIKIPDTAEQMYFPFYFGGYPIALLLNGIENFQTILLSKEEGDIVYGRLALNGVATLMLQLIPTAADSETPMLLDNMKQYPLLTDIAYIGLLNRQTEQIWAWKNSKYDGSKTIGSGSRSLLNLMPDTKQ